MATLARLERLNLPLATVAAATAGGVIALAFLVMPAGLLEGLVLSSGIAAFVAAAEPPLGLTARIALALVGGGATAGFVWLGAKSLLGTRDVTVGQAGALLRQAARSDAPPRPPLFATRDLGTPFLEIKAPAEPPAEPIDTPPAVVRDTAPVEQPLPVDLDQPLAAFDPAAILPVPIQPTPAVAPLARPQLIDPGDRFETFELTPVARTAPISLRVVPDAVDEVAAPRAPASAVEPPPEPVMAAATEASVHALLARLERGITRREATPKSTGSLQDTLGDLRKLATGG